MRCISFHLIWRAVTPPPQSDALCPALEALIGDGGQITLGAVGPVRNAAIAAQPAGMLAALVLSCVARVKRYRRFCSGWMLPSCRQFWKRQAAGRFRRNARAVFEVAAAGGAVAKCFGVDMDDDLMAIAAFEGRRALGEKTLRDDRQCIGLSGRGLGEEFYIRRFRRNFRTRNFFASSFDRLDEQLPRFRWQSGFDHEHSVGVIKPCEFTIRLLLSIAREFLGFFAAAEVAHDAFDVRGCAVERVLEEGVLGVLTGGARECADLGIAQLSALHCRGDLRQAQ